MQNDENIGVHCTVLSNHSTISSFYLLALFLVSITTRFIGKQSRYKMTTTNTSHNVELLETDYLIILNTLFLPFQCLRKSWKKFCVRCLKIIIPLFHSMQESWILNVLFWIKYPLTNLYVYAYRMASVQLRYASKI